MADRKVYRMRYRVASKDAPSGWHDWRYIDTDFPTLRDARDSAKDWDETVGNADWLDWQVIEVTETVVDSK